LKFFAWWELWISLPSPPAGFKDARSKSSIFPGRFDAFAYKAREGIVGGHDTSNHDFLQML
jgi:hypothetical protein